MLNAHPGDVVLVARRNTFGEWLRHPISSLISWRIRSSTGSKWSHVACYVGGGYVVEAEWDRGVTRTHFVSSYDPTRFVWKVVPPPSGLDREECVAFWHRTAEPGLSVYDRKALIAMRVNVLLWGHDGLKRYVASKDNAYICSELAEAGWMAGGYRGLSLLVPGDFDRTFSAPVAKRL